MSKPQNTYKTHKSLLASLFNGCGELKSRLPFFNNTRKHAYKDASCFCEYLSNTGLYNSEDDVIANFDTFIEQMREYLDGKGYKAARVTIDLMLEKNTKADGTYRLRADKKSQSPLHEITEALWIISMREEGLLDKLKPNEIDLILSLAFAHDLGEDFNIRARELDNYILHNKAISTDYRMENIEMLEVLQDRFHRISKYYGKEGKEDFHAGKNKGRDVDGKYRDEHEFHEHCRADCYTGDIKTVDVVHNNMTLVGVRNTNTVNNKIAIAEHHYKPKHIKEMCRKFPEHAKLYETMGELIPIQRELLHYYTTGDLASLPDNEMIREMCPKRGFSFVPDGFNPILVIAERIRKEYKQVCENKDSWTLEN